MPGTPEIARRDFGRWRVIVYADEHGPVASFLDLNANRSRFPDGQFTGGCYYVDTLLGRDGYGWNIAEARYGLCLNGAEPDWTVLAADCFEIAAWLEEFSPSKSIKPRKFANKKRSKKTDTYDVRAYYDKDCIGLAEDYLNCNPDEAFDRTWALIQRGYNVQVTNRDSGEWAVYSDRDLEYLDMEMFLRLESIEYVPLCHFCGGKANPSRDPAGAYSAYCNHCDRPLYEGEIDYVPTELIQPNRKKLSIKKLRGSNNRGSHANPKNNLRMKLKNKR
jgi:hypothetical protein